MACAYKTLSKMPYQKGLSKNCQFNKQLDELIEFKGKAWCEYHLPLEARDSAGCEKRDWSGKQLSLFYDCLFQDVHELKRECKAMNFTGVQFPGVLDLLPWHFLGNKGVPILFIDSVFEYLLRLESITFNADVRFYGTVFKNGFDFEHLRFEGDCRLDNIECNGVASFDEITILGDLSLDKARFHEALTIEKNTNLKNINARRCLFYGPVHADSVNFGSGVYFVGSKFYSDADFSGGTGDKLEIVSFRGVEFHGVTDFSNREFVRDANFSMSIFHDAPRFHNSDIHQGSTFRGARFLDHQSYAAPQAYRTLKLVMEKNRAWDDMAMFYALEQKSISHQPETSKQVKVMSWAYEVASDYGRSFLRPLAGLLWTAYVAFELYCLSLALMGISGDGQLIWDVMAFDLKQMVKPFDAIAGGIPIDDLGGFGKFIFGTIATLQTIATAGFVTLFILAVRRRFRMA